MSAVARPSTRFATSLVTACAATAFLMWLSGITNDEVEMAVFWDIVWLIPWNATGLYMIIACGKRITKELEKGAPVWICLRNVIRTSYNQNMPLVSALLFAIIATVCCYSVLLGHHTVEWLQILCINATFWSAGIMAIMLFCLAMRNTTHSASMGQFSEDHPSILSLVSLMASLAVWSQLSYGPAICVIATVTNFSGFQSIAWYFYDFMKFHRSGPDCRGTSLVGVDGTRLVNVDTMTPGEVGDFLRSHGFVEYAETFERHLVKGEHLSKLTAAGLEKMSVDIVGHQMDLLSLFSRYGGSGGGGAMFQRCGGA